jgi:hypothetical protein
MKVLHYQSLVELRMHLGFNEVSLPRSGGFSTYAWTTAGSFPEAGDIETR